MVKLVWIALASCLLSPVPANADERCVGAPDRAVVMLRVTANNQTQYGAGVIFAVRDGSIFIMTAKHVVQLEKPDIKVMFKIDEATAYSAQSRVYLGQNIDAAFLVVKNNDLAEQLESQLDWPILPAGKSAAESKYATIIGNNSGKPWSKPLDPERIIRHRSDGIEIDSRSLRPGASGGGVFDPNDQLIGIVSEDMEGQVALAMPIDSVLREAHSLGLPVNVTVNSLATPAVFVSPLTGSAGDWGDDIATALVDKLKHSRRVLDCGNEQALSITGTVDIRSGTPTSDLAILSWRFSGGRRGAAPASVDRIEINHFPWTDVRKDKGTLASKTDQAVDFAIAQFNRYLAH
jgi:hypothetical protein